MGSNEANIDEETLKKYRETASYYSSTEQVIKSVVDPDVSHASEESPSVPLEGEEFKRFLRENGVNETSVDILFEEEIVDLKTLKILNEHDFESLDLKTGQRARIRKLMTTTEWPESKSKTASGPSVKSVPPVQSAPPVQSVSPFQSPPSVQSGPSFQSGSSVQSAPSIHSPPSVQSGLSFQSGPSFQSGSSVQSAPSIHSPPSVQSGPSFQSGSSMQSAPSRIQRSRHGLDKPVRKSRSKTDIANGGKVEDDEKEDMYLRPLSTKQKSIEKDEVELNYHCLKTDEKGKVVIALSTLTQDEIKPLPARILLLVDISGSMGIKSGKGRRHSKLSRMKKFAMAMIDSLDDGDYTSLVTFGKDANVLLPLKEVNPRTRNDMKKILETLDKTYLSTKTDLGAGLSTSLDVIHEMCAGKEDLLKYRNTIIVFSDGEVNEGTTNPAKLVHEVREKIRKLSFGLDDAQSQWISISTIATGNEVSEAMFMLSKYCSSDAFYHLDVMDDKQQVELFLPVLLRKAAVAWNVSLFVKALNGASIINEESSQDNKVRLRSSTKSHLRQEKAYFYYDIPAASEKHIGIALNLQFADEEPETEVLRLKVAYTGLSGKRKEFTKTITRIEIESTDKDKIYEAISANMMHDARLISQNALQMAADRVKEGKTSASTAVIQDGQSNLKQLLDKYGEMAEEAEDDSVRPHLISYADALMQNMQSLLNGLETSMKENDDNEPDGKNWSKIQAVSSAISREAPTMSDANTDTSLGVLAPLPNVRRISSNLRLQAEDLYKQQGANAFQPTLTMVKEEY